MTETADELITDASKLVIGRHYVIETDEPHGTFHVGAFLGWSFYIAPNGGNQDDEFVTTLPDNWDDRFPNCHFERGVVVDHYMLQARLVD